MPQFDRRTFFRIAGAAGAASVAAAASPARASVSARPGATGVLVDTTKCVGCRGCEAACSEANKLPEPATSGEGAVFASRRTTSPDSFTVVNKAVQAGPGGEERFAKTQCMHCIEPSCASACCVKALEKTAEGPVVYHANKCLGCRYCMVACPFDVPKYTYNKPIPIVRKCTFCAERQKAGQAPACTEVCPSGALTFGKREELLELARTRIYQDPGKYVHHVYGETEAGGTSWMYISDIPFEKVGLDKRVSTKSYPSMTQGALSTVPFVLTLWPPLLMGLYAFNKRKDEVSKNGENGHE
jgi:Fe-S-cluster-containing dehydrogenase component